MQRARLWVVGFLFWDADPKLLHDRRHQSCVPDHGEVYGGKREAVGSERDVPNPVRETDGGEPMLCTWTVLACVGYDTTDSIQFGLVEKGGEEKWGAIRFNASIEKQKQYRSEITQIEMIGNSTSYK